MRSLPEVKPAKPPKLNDLAAIQFQPQLSNPNIM
jgi:hypothetical protein